MKIFDRIKSFFKLKKECPDISENPILSLTEELPLKEHEIDIASDEEMNYSKLHKIILSHGGVKTIVKNSNIFENKSSHSVDDDIKKKWMDDSFSVFGRKVD